MFKLRFRSYITAFLVALVVMFHTAPAFAAISAYDADPLSIQVMLHTTPAFAAISTYDAGPMRNAGPLSKQYILAARRVIYDLAFSMLAGGAGTITDNGVVRIDRQGQTAAGDLNLQVQIDNKQGASTIAAAIIPSRYFNGVTNPHTMGEVLNKVQSALLDSLNSLYVGNGEIFGLQGDPSN